MSFSDPYTSMAKENMELFRENESLKEQLAEARAEAESWKACAENQPLSPCGHAGELSHTEDGGKTIRCYVCELAEARKENAQLRDAKDADNSCMTSMLEECKKLQQQLDAANAQAAATIKWLRDFIVDYRRGCATLPTLESWLDQQEKDGTAGREIMGRLRRYEEALEFYASKGHFTKTGRVVVDEGERARLALKELK